MRLGRVDVCGFCEGSDEVWKYSFEDHSGDVLCDTFLEEFGFCQALFDKGGCSSFLRCECLAAEQEIELSQLVEIIGGRDCVECVSEVCFVVRCSAWSGAVVV